MKIWYDIFYVNPNWVLQKLEYKLFCKYDWNERSYRKNRISIRLCFSKRIEFFRELEKYSAK